MYLNGKRYEEIKMRVVEIFEKYDVRCIPINAFELAVKMGIKVIPYSAYSEKKQQILQRISPDGFAYCFPTGKWWIFYEDKRPYGRLHHTLMHEIGHIALDHTEHSDLAEAEAGYFAKYALAPPVFIHRLGLQTANEIQMRFEISYEAATYALKFYRKWLQYGPRYYTDYERKLCKLFGYVM